MNSQFVDDGDVGLAARRLAPDQRGDQVAGSVHDFAAIGHDSDLQAQRGGRLLQEGQVAGLEVQGHGVDGIARHDSLLGVLTTSFRACAA